MVERTARIHPTRRKCKKPEIRCPASAFRCNYGACINRNYTCNGIKDCVDNSDETQAECNRNNGTINQTRRALRCGNDEYRCDNGQCIFDHYKCDGTQHCQDGSDEIFRLCVLLPCPLTAFRCANGACVDSDLQCNGIANCADNSDEDAKLCGYQSTGATQSPRIRPSGTPSVNTCTAPPQPRNGHWKLNRSQCLDEQDCNVLEGTELRLGSHIIYSCNLGYRISSIADITCSSQGKWEPSLPINPCIRILCRTLDSTSTRAECTYKSAWISCKSAVPTETKAEISFKNNYGPTIDLDVPQSNNVTCNEHGQWEPEPVYCTPVCGAIVHDRPTIFWGFDANSHRVQFSFTEFPWHVSMYRIYGGEERFFCSATIIQENLLITAAHCVYDDIIRQLDKPNEIYILTGNIFLDYNNPSHNPEFSRRNQVKRIYVDRRYRGFEGNFHWDVAILELVTPFVFSAKFVPACMDTLNDRSGWILEEEDFEEVFGKTMGYGRTASGETSTVLQIWRVPVIRTGQCLTATERINDTKYFSYDKFCGYTNDSLQCNGISGGGLVFLNDGLWYLRGIVSIALGMKIEDETASCDNNTYTLYTDVSKHISWIQRVITQIKYNQTHILCSETSTTRCS